MRAVILAAGRGSRMNELGDVRPKCLVELAGRTLLERQVAALRDGVRPRLALSGVIGGRCSIDPDSHISTIHAGPKPTW